MSAASSGVTVFPSLKEVSLEPGQAQAAFVIKLKNSTPADVNLRLSVVDFKALDETGGVAFLGESNDLERRYGLAPWAKLDKTSLKLLPGQTAGVQVTIINQPSLAPGGHYGAVLFKTVNSADRGGGQQVQLNQVFSTLILAKKLGGERLDVNLSGYDKATFRFNLPDQLKLRFANSGNVHAAPTGVVKIVDPLGREVASGPVNPEAGRILPDSYRTYPTKLKPVKPAFIPGLYRTIIQYSYDGKPDQTTVSSQFLFVNAVLVLPVAVVLIIFLWLRLKRSQPFPKSFTRQLKPRRPRFKDFQRR
ncbi:MAG TPA: hypothetical protein VK963_03250 [Candidatus Saccharimonadales bacterium]|nr:hypothetical protein [Candidatus Saccharimonadales bacterium]